MNGKINGWRASLNTTAETLFTAPAGTEYTGLTSATVASAPLLYAADTSHGKIDVYNNAGSTTLTGNFVDPTIPAGFTPYVQTSLECIYVTLRQGRAPGGFVSVFNAVRHLVKRLAFGRSLELAVGNHSGSIGFGTLGGDLLIGNEGDKWHDQRIRPQRESIGTLPALMALRW